MPYWEPPWAYSRTVLFCIRRSHMEWPVPRPPSPTLPCTHWNGWIAGSFEMRTFRTLQTGSAPCTIFRFSEWNSNRTPAIPHNTPRCPDPSSPLPLSPIRCRPHSFVFRSCSARLFRYSSPTASVICPFLVLCTEPSNFEPAKPNSMEKKIYKNNKSKKQKQISNGLPMLQEQDYRFN